MPSDVARPLFRLMHRNAMPVTDFLRDPNPRLVEMGSPIAI